MTATRKFTVNAVWDDEAKVWVATSDDVPGLVTEATTCEGLLKKLEVIIPELLEANGILASEDLPEIPIHLLSERDSTIKLRTT